MIGSCLALALAMVFFAAGCGGGDTVTVPPTVSISPSAVSALVSSFVQFSLTVNGAVDSVTFLVNDVENGNGTVGTITTDGLYHAPAVVPANTAITVKAKVAFSSGTSADATATVTLDSGVRVSIVPASYTIGTAEQFQFSTKVRVSGVPPNAAIANVCDSDALTALPLCTSVTWSVSGGGSIDATTGSYTAPSTTGTATVTATSIYDATRKANATITLVTATDPTLTSISNDVGAVGATLQDIYLTGTNFISTTQVRANDGVTTNLVTDTNVVSSTVLRVRLSADDLDTPGALTFTASRQGGADKGCSTPCTLTLSAQRPAIVGTTPDSISASSAADVVVNGGYYGTSLNPTVTASFEGQLASIDSANRLRVAFLGSSPLGLAPVTVTSSVPGAAVGPAVANVAIQPSTTPPPPPTPTPVGIEPSSVAINTATGIAVVANQGSNSVTLINLAGPTVLGFICTANQSAPLQPNDSSCTAPSAPTSVAVDNLRNLALVTNSGTTDAATHTVAVIDLTTFSVREVIPNGASSIADVPWGVGINPLSGRAVVAYQTAGFASLIDLNQTPAKVIGLVAASTGPTPRVAVSPRLNWALVTPGGAGSLAIVDLGRQNTNPISSAVRSGNIVTITTGTAHILRVGDPVLITGVSDATFNGVFNVTGVSENTFTYSQNGSNVSSSGASAIASYSLPIATVATSVSVTGVGINDETQKAILVDPTGPQAQFFSLLDQTITGTVGLELKNNIAGAFNPFTNVAVTVNKTDGNGAVIDPTAAALIGGNGTISGLITPVDVAIDPATNTAIIVNSPPSTTGSVSFVFLGAVRTPQILQVSRQDNGAGNPLPPEITVNSTLSIAATANPQTLRIIGSGFTGSSVVQLDGVPLVGAPTVVSDRELTVSVPASMLTAGPRLYAVQVVNGGNTSNAATFTVAQSVDISSSGCTTSAPQGVAIDYSSRNLAVVTDPGCNSVAIINLGGLSPGTGQTVGNYTGKNPQGVAVHIQSALAVVANADDSTASIVDINGNTVVGAPVSTDPTPVGVAIDQGLAKAVVTSSNANVVDTFAVSSSPGTPTSIAVQSRPIAVAVDPETHLAAVANTTSNTISLVDLTQAAATQHIPANGLPAGIAFDPVSETFLAVASQANQLLVLDPVSRTTTTLRIGINPTSVAYNFNSDTLVTTNSSSQTMSVVDFLGGRVRAVLSFKPSSRFAVDIHPFTNLAVLADPVDRRVILRPLPR